MGWTTSDFTFFFCLQILESLKQLSCSVLLMEWTWTWLLRSGLGCNTFCWFWLGCSYEHALELGFLRVFELLAS